MAAGMAAHEAGDRVRALSAFEAALVMAPGHVQAASACATLLFELARPRAALACLQTVEAQLLADADGAANLGITHAACGEREAARACFVRALAHDAGHTRALQHLAALHAQDQQWDAALACAMRWLAAATGQEAAWLAVAEVLMGARRLEEAQIHLAQALQHFPGHQALGLQQAVVLARCGQLDTSDARLAALAGTAVMGQQPAEDARSIFYRHAVEALQDCDWRAQDRLLAVVQQDLAVQPGAAAKGSGANMRAALLCGPLLPLSDREMQLAAQAMWQTLRAGPANPGRPFSAADVLNRQGPIRVGIAARSLRDEAATAELAALLALHDTTRFDFYVYSPTPQPQAALAQALAPHRVIEIAHFSDDEAVGRIRLDRLDIWLDLSFGTPAWRPALAARRMAPVQVQHPGWPAPSAGAPFDYTLSDAFIHPQPDAGGGGDHAALLRLPHTCWPATPVSTGDAAATITREQAGLPAQALVLCGFAPAPHIDSHSFSVWMQVLGQLPEAVLWLPPLAASTQANLRREAETAGIAASRLCFAVAATRQHRQHRLACLALADLFLDTLRISARQDLGDALALGVPALSCAGPGMTSRTGGSMLRAAGLADCVFDNEASYVAAALRLGRDGPALQQVRARLQASHQTAPLFDLPARVRELEAAWSFMAERARAGLAPERLDLPAYQA
jgi:predicted O-linked N-acetylglucosamine transferase (SPINDLY family)